MNWKVILVSIALAVGSFFLGKSFKKCEPCSAAKEFVEIKPYVCPAKIVCAKCRTCPVQVKCPAQKACQPQLVCKPNCRVDWNTGKVQVDVPPGIDAEIFLNKNLKGAVWKASK